MDIETSPFQVFTHFDSQHQLLLNNTKNIKLDNKTKKSLLKYCNIHTLYYCLETFSFSLLLWNTDLAP